MINAAFSKTIGASFLPNLKISKTISNLTVKRVLMIYFNSERERRTTLFGKLIRTHWRVMAFIQISMNLKLNGATGYEICMMGYGELRKTFIALFNLFEAKRESFSILLCYCFLILCLYETMRVLQATS